VNELESKGHRKDQANNRKLKIRDGCHLHESCETCPYPDCAINDLQAQKEGVVIGTADISA